MNNIDIILNNTTYVNSLNKLKEYEKDRQFCNHTLEHFIDVGRIAYIMVLEEGLDISKEVIYAIGLLHDIGRVKQYEEGIDHDIASVEMSKEILKDTDFSEDEINSILKGIANHRQVSENRLEEIIYNADKLSRQCFNCNAESQCYWSSEKKNFNITY